MRLERVGRNGEESALVEISYGAVELVQFLLRPSELLPPVLLPEAYASC